MPTRIYMPQSSADIPPPPQIPSAEESAFHEIPLLHKHVKDFNQFIYRIYETPEKYMEVEASAAYEAMQKSGLKKAKRIERYMKRVEEIMVLEQLVQDTEDMALRPAHVPDVMTPEKAVELAAASAQEQKPAEPAAAAPAEPAPEAPKA